MPIPSILSLTQLPGRAPASPAAIAAAERALERSLPDDYRAFLLESNGVEGFVGESYFVLWPVETVEEVAAVNRENPYFVDGLVMIGGDGGGEGLGFLRREGGDRYVQVPVVPLLEEDMETVGESLVQVVALVRSRGLGPAFGHLAGELDPWPPRDRLAAALRSGGLRITEGRYSIRVEECSRWSFECYGGDISEPSIDADAETVGRLLEDARRVSVALAAARMRHRFEVYNGHRALKGYFHFDWPRDETGTA